MLTSYRAPVTRLRPPTKPPLSHLECLVLAQMLTRELAPERRVKVDLDWIDARQLCTRLLEMAQGC